jgi:membrane protease subunit HflK
MERNIRKIGTINWLVLLLAAALTVGLGRYSHSFAAQVLAVFFLAGKLIALMSRFQMGLEEKERLEKLEFDELTREKASSSLFNAGEADAFPARHAREQFEKWVLPIFAVLLVVGLGIEAVVLWNFLKNATVEPIVQPMVTASLLGVQALILFVTGKYSANLARLDGQRLVRPASSFQVFGAYLSMAVAICIGLVYGGQTRADWWMARIVIAVLGIITIEGVISLILEIYRPRVKGKQVHLIYESRVIGLMGQPEGIFSTAATALDYQFGFKVSETWFYRFLQNALAWLILVQLAVLVLSSTIVFIDPGEQGLIERWGRPRGEHVLNPGAHVKWPWPMEKVYRFGTDQIQTFTVGMVADTNETAHAVLWTVKHAKEEFNLLVASRDQGAGGTSTNKGSVPADLLSVSIPVQYQIRNVNDFAYKHLNGGKLLEEIATREVVRYLVGVDIFDIMSSGRQKASEDLQKLIQEQADARELGVKILFVGLQDIHPPVKVAPSYELVIGTRQEMESSKRKAEGYAARALAMSGAEAQKRIFEAQAYSAKKVSGAQAQAARYKNQLAGYLASPTVFTNRAYLEAWAHGSTNARKYVLAVTNTTDSVQINLEDKIREDLTEIGVPKPK